jgi:hypothetical protein
MKIITNTSIDKKDIAKATTTNNKIVEHAGETFNITDIIIYSKENSDGVETTVASIKTELGFLMTTSPTVMDVLDVIIASYSIDEIHEGVEVEINSAKSSKGRDFFYLTIA